MSDSVSIASNSVQPGRNGGTLRRGNPGNRGGAVNNPAAIRAKLRDLIAKRPEALAEIIDGRPTELRKVLLADILPNVDCPNCGESGLTLKADVAKDVEVTCLISAAPKDRIAAWDTAAKYGLGSLKEVSVENVRERLGQTLDVIRQQLPPEQAAGLIAALRGVWG